LISVNATDYVHGVAFPFLSTSFNAICSDLNAFHVARAVAASAAFPFLFSPVTLDNHAAHCNGVRAPDGISTEAGQDAGMARQAELARVARSYANPEETRWIHLMDGGLADNLGLRGLFNLMLALGDDHDIVRELARRTRRIVVLSVDGQAAVDQRLSQQPSISGFRQIFNATYYTQVDAYNFETRILMTEAVQTIARRFARIRCEEAQPRNGGRCDDVTGSFIHVSLADIPDREARVRLQSTATSASIPPTDIQDLVSYGERLVRDHPLIRRVATEAAARLARQAERPATR